MMLIEDKIEAIRFGIEYLTGYVCYTDKWSGTTQHRFWLNNLDGQARIVSKEYIAENDIGKLTIEFSDILLKRILGKYY